MTERLQDQGHYQAAPDHCHAVAISVIVPVYNHWHLIPTLLECLARQRYRQEDFEVLLSDNGSDAIPLMPKLPANVRILKCDLPGSYAARNHAIQRASGRILAFTDADCRPSPQWLSCALELIERHPHVDLMVAGKVLIVPANAQHPNPYELFDITLGIPQDRYVTQGFGATANLVVPRSVFDKAGLFDASRYSGGDAEFCRRATANGATLTYHDDALVEHPARMDWASLAAKARRIKGGQICTGSPRERIRWSIQTLFPPIVSWHKVLSSPAMPRAQRVAVCAVHTRLWLLGIREALMLLLRFKTPDR